jgi:CRP-like cAMP-binding protein
MKPLDAPSREWEPNRILRRLSHTPQAHLAPALESVSVQAKQVLLLAEAPVRYVYFPRDAVLSLLVPMADGTAVEGAIIGNEGLVGLQVFLGEGAAIEQIVVQVPGEVMRMRADDFRNAVARSYELQMLLQRYTLALMNQLARTAGCNRMHSVEERAARWLLMCHDRAGRDTFPLTQEVLASLLGVQRALVRVAIDTLQDAGLIRYHQGSITVPVAERLEAVTCEDYRLSRTAYDQMYAV